MRGCEDESRMNALLSNAHWTRTLNHYCEDSCQEIILIN